MMKIYQDFQIELSGVCRLAKMFFEMRLAKSREYQGNLFSMMSKPKILLLFSVLLPLVFPMYALIIVALIVPVPPAIFDFVEVNTDRENLIAFFGNGLTLVGFCIILLFAFAFWIGFSNMRTDFRTGPHAELLHCSPIPLRKLLAGELLSTALIRDYWICASILSFYLVYQLWVGLPLTILEIVLLVTYSLVLSITGTLLGFTLGILSLGGWRHFLLSKTATITMVVIFLSILALISDFLLGMIIYQPFTPLGWVTMGVYSSISGKRQEFQLTIIIAVILLLISILLVPKQIPKGDVQVRKKVLFKKPGTLQNILKTISCYPFRGKTRKLAGILFVEEWERKRPFKFLFLAILVVIMFLITQSFLYRFIPSDFHPYIPVVSFLYSIVAPVSSQLQREMAYSFFNLDGRFLFYRSTPLGFSSVSKICLAFLITWQIPVIVAGTLSALLINQLAQVFTWISLAIAAVLLITTAVFLAHSFRPRYHTTTSVQLDDSLLLLPLTAFLVLFLTVAGEMLAQMFPDLIAAIIIFSAALLISVLGMRWGIKRLEREESLH